MVLYDLSRFSALFTDMDLYVACTRAKHLLVTLTTDGEVRQVVEHMVNAADGEGAKG